MSTVIRATDPGLTAPVAFNFDDMAARARGYLDQVRAEAAEIVAQARRDAEAVRSRAEEEGREAALRQVEQIVEKQLAVALPALRQVSDEILRDKQAWLTHWEASTVHVAAAIAGRLVRRELQRDPQITVTLVREALELASGSAEVRIHLNPDDHAAMGRQVQILANELSGLGTAELVADAAVTRGGCRVETRFGVIDQQFEAQLARIEEELTSC